MKKALTFMMASACVLGALSTQASMNLVQDPGFEGSETGTLSVSSSPWFNPNPGSTAVSIGTVDPNSGLQNATLTANSTVSAVMAQAITLVAGGTYSISFYAATPSSAGGDIAVSLNGVYATPNGASGVAIADGTAYTQYTYTTSPVNASGLLSFIWTSTSSSNASVQIDDISVTPVPEPTTMVAGALMLLPFAASTLRLRKKVSA